LMEAVVRRYAAHQRLSRGGRVHPYEGRTGPTQAGVDSGEALLSLESFRGAGAEAEGRPFTADLDGSSPGAGRGVVGCGDRAPRQRGHRARASPPFPLSVDMAPMLRTLPWSAQPVIPCTEKGIIVKISSSAVSLNVDDVRVSSAFLTTHFGFHEVMAADGFASLAREDAGIIQLVDWNG